MSLLSVRRRGPGVPPGEMAAARRASASAAVGGPILVVGHRGGGRVTGVRAGVELVVTGLAGTGLPHRVVDLADAGPAIRAGSYSPRRAVATLRLVVRAWAALLGCARVYLALGASRPGFARDALLIWPAALLRRRIVLHMFGGGYGRFQERQPPALRWLIRVTLGRAHLLIVEGRLLRRQFGFLDRGRPRIRVVPNGLPVGLDPPGGPRTLGGEADVRLLFLSNMMPAKGYLEVLEVCEILVRDHGMRVHCDFAGEFVVTIDDDGDADPAARRDAFLRRVAALGLEHAVHYHGVVTGGAKHALLERAHFFLLPTRYAWEGQPLSIIEALAFGLPVIASPHRGIPELVRDGVNGYLVDAARPDLMAARIRESIADPDRYAELSRNAVRHYQRRFTRKRHQARVCDAILRA